jgi:phosphoglycerate dehydrogenase-like enzyme
VRIIVPARFRAALAPRLPVGIEVAWYDSIAGVLDAVVRDEVAWTGNNDSEGLRRLVATGASLRWISTHGAGIESFPVGEMARRGILLTNGAGISAVPVAEFALLGMLALAKNLPAYVRAQDHREWLASAPGLDELAGSRALIIGYGGIGRAIAARLGAFDVAVTAVRRTPRGEAHVIAPDQWRERLPEFDWIVLAAPLTSGTRSLIGRAELDRLRPAARIVNVARGGLVDEPALVEALVAGRVAGAYLDVTDPEPPPPSAALWSAPNVILSAHLSGSATHRLEERSVRLFLDNLGRFQASEPLLNLVNLWESGAADPL